MKTTDDARSQALNLALMYQRQVQLHQSDEDVVKTAEKFREFLDPAEG